MRAAILARVSTEEQARGMSIDDQITRCREFAAARGWIVAAVIEEPGDTGSRVLYQKTARGQKFQPRPGIRRLLDLAEAGKIDAVLATVQDRYHRNEYEFEQLLREHLSVHNVTAWTFAGPLADDTPFDWQARKAEGNYAEMHSRLTSYKVRESNKLARRRGELISGRPFGTKSVPGKRDRVRDPETWPILQEIFARSAAGEPHQRIARDLASREVPTVEGGRWHQATVRSIVTCPWYIGQLRHKDQLVIDAEGAPVITVHDCMIDSQLWASAQRVGQKGRPAALPHDFLLQGLVVSSHFVLDEPERLAGRPAPYRRRMSKGKPTYRAAHSDDPYYSATAADEGAEQMPLTLPAKELESIVVERLIEAARNDEVVKMALEDAELEAADSDDRKTEILRSIDDLAGEILRTEQQLLAAFEGGLTETARLLDEKVAALRSKLDKMPQHLDRAHMDQLRSKMDVEAVQMINRIEQCWQEGRSELLRGIIAALVDHIDVRVDGIEVILRSDPPAKNNTRRGRGSSPRSA